jgi:hypothetical protein
MRSRKGARLFEAHRDHLYQLWLRRTGRSHAALAVRGFALTAAYALAGLAAERAAPEVQPLLWILGFLIAAAGWKAMRRRFES